MAAGEREEVMVQGRWFPAGIGRMAHFACDREFGILVFRVGGGIVGVEVAGNTFAGDVGIVTRCMASKTIADRMTGSKREKGVIDIGRGP